jgi:puromycin-sensitive aminopeptidase
MDGWIFHPGYPMVSARLEGGQLVLEQQRFTYLRDPLDSVPGRTAAPSVDRDQRWQIPLQIRVENGSASRVQRVLLSERETTVALPGHTEAVVVNEGGHGFYRVRYSRDLLQRLLRRLPSGLAPIERFNLLGDAWAATVAGLMPIEEYLDLTAEFRGERDKNVWVILVGSLSALNRIIPAADRSGLERLVHDRIAGAVEELGWTPRPDEDELRRQLRGDLIRALGTLGNDPATHARAAEVYAAHVRGSVTVDPNVLPSLIGILAHVGDAARYDEFFKAFRSSTTPQEEQRYLYALVAFQPRPLVAETLAKTINGEVRTQDAPFVARAMLMTVHGRELAWDFIRANWGTMERQYPKHGLRRMAEGVIGLATPELERSVHEFFAERKIDLGGKTLEQYLEQLRVAVTLRGRDGARLGAYLARC